MPANKPTSPPVTDETVQRFIADRVKKNIGAGKRFETQAAYEEALKAASKEFKTAVADTPRNREETALIAGTLALSSEDCSELNRLARLAIVPITGNLQADVLFDQRVSTITAWTVQKYTTKHIAEHPVTSTAATDQTPTVTTKPPEIPEPKKPEPKASASKAPAAKSSAPEIKTKKEPAQPKASNPSTKPKRSIPRTPPEVIKPPSLPKTAPRVERKALHERSKEIDPKLEYAFPKEHCGDALLADAIEHKYTIGQVLSAGLERLSKTCQRTISHAEFAELLDITPAQYGKFARNEHSAPPTELMDTISTKMGASTDAQKAEWRKFILNIPAYRNQDMLNICFDDEAKWTQPKSNPHARRTIIDPDSTDRKTDVYVFFKLLQDVHGYSNLGQLAAAIVPKPVEGRTASDLQKTVLQITSGHAARINPESLGPVIRATAAFAFPGKDQEALRQMCIEFLSSEKHLKPVEGHKKPFHGLQFPYGQKGRGLLDDYRVRGKSFADLLGDVHKSSGGSVDAFCEALGIATSLYRNWMAGEYPQAIKLSELNALAKKFGANSPDEEASWRQFMLGIPHEYNAAMVNSCFEAKIANEPDGDIKRVTVDTEKFNDERAPELRKFFDLLKKQRGVLNNAQLAEIIIAEQKVANFDAERLESVLNNAVNVRSRILPEYAAVVARFAFKSQREQDLCVSFLSSERYLPSNDPTKPEEEPAKLVFPEGKTGKALLQYARDQELAFGQLLEEIRTGSALSKAACAALLDMEGSIYRRFAEGDTTGFAFSTYNSLAEKLGAETERDKAEWRKFMRGIPVEVNQSLVDGCFEKDSTRFIDVEATGKTRTVALARFFHLLMQQAGCNALENMTTVIAAHANQPDMAGRINRYIKAVSGNIDITTATMPEASTCIESVKPDAYKIMPDDAAKAIAAFAFPDHENKGEKINNSERRLRCIDFLTNERYLDPEQPDAPKILTFPENKTGNDLLQYAYDKKLTFAQLLAEIRALSRMHMYELGPKLGLTYHRYSDFESDKYQNITAAEFKGLAEKLGAKTPEDYLNWRKFIAGISKDITQDTLDNCFNADSPHRIDPELMGQEHNNAAGKFFELVAHRHGFINWMDLASAAATHANLGPSIATQLNGAIHKMARHISQNGSEPLPPVVRVTPAMPKQFGEMLANFAFQNTQSPEGVITDRSALRAKAIEFLSGDKYRGDRAEQYKRRSETMKKRRADPNSGYNKKKNPTQNDPTSGAEQGL